MGSDPICRMIAVSIDGVLTAPQDARISIFDRGFLYGDGLFEVLRTWSGVAIDLAAHLDRLRRSAAALELHVHAQLEGFVRAAIGAAGPGDHRVRIIVTRGPGPISARFSELGPGRSIVIVEPLPLLPAEISLAIVDYPVAQRAGTTHKALAYLDHLIARELAAATGADEAARLGPMGEVVEGATANIFAVSAGTVITPPVAGILPGVTRARVLAVCAVENIRTAERPISVDELRAADELFVTSAVRGVVPVTRLDGEQRVAGPLTRRIATVYLAALRQQSPGTAI